MGVILFFWMVFAVLIGVWADSRGQNGWVFGLLALIVSPVLMALVVLITRNIKEEERLGDLRREDNERHLAHIKALTSPAAHPAAAAAPKASKVELLTRLGELNSAHALTQEEFDKVKAACLSDPDHVAKLDLMTELAELHKLFKMSVLTDQEFQQQKSMLILANL